MRLKKIEISGFKSFAKQTSLELPAAISAIVGPNGSGKSNVVEGIRWALGEQAFKNLRGKKSEDFIFNGSSSMPRLGKASVSLFFDMGDRPEIFGYEEFVLSRRVYRDGVNEYYVNDSQVRLKDIIEMLSKVGLGASSHHIISQGEADRILSASSKEKREMFEDALSLKIYQLKRQEAERKLERTEDNISRVESLRKEIQPHLRFLKKQAEKVERALNLREKLNELCKEYFSKEENFLGKEFIRIEKNKKGPFLEAKNLEEKIKKLKEEVGKEQKDIPQNFEIKKLELELENFRSQKNSLERDLGRCEGMIDFHEAQQKEASKELVEKNIVEKFIEKLNSCLDEGLVKETFEKIRKIINEFSSEIKIRKQEALNSEIENLKDKQNKITESIESVKKEESLIAKKLLDIKLELENKERGKRDAERELYNSEISIGNLRNILKSFELEEEKIKARKEELVAEKQSAIHFLGTEFSLVLDENNNFLSSLEREEKRREIERLKIRLEDSEGVGDDVLREYQQVKTRDDFFSKELEDLSKAAESLKDLMKELGDKIDNDFQKGILEINKEFQNFFTIMFGGGNAELKIVRNEKKKKEKKEEDLEENLSEEEAVEETEEGIEISVNIPRKRIRSLEMLSGGERALTSIALLFAMTQVNPPPFLILDETDAALDESNSQKYGKMLKDLSKRTQLILITHNRETMKQAGVLYGVTMGSSGFSQILSVKFDEAEELAAKDR